MIKVHTFMYCISEKYYFFKIDFMKRIISINFTQILNKKWFHFNTLFVEYLFKTFKNYLFFHTQLHHQGLHP